MVKTRRNPTNRSKQPVATILNKEEIDDRMIDTSTPKTPYTERSVDTSKYNKDNGNTREGSSSIREQLRKTPSKERF